MFNGSITALITPFKNGGIDEDGFQAFVDWQVAEGSNGLVPVGTTGESPTLSHAEHKRVVELCVEAADGRVPVIAGDWMVLGLAAPTMFCGPLAESTVVAGVSPVSGSCGGS